MLTYGVVFLHDNARLHKSTAARTRALLVHFNWECFDCPPYSPALAPSDYHLFTDLKNWLQSQRSQAAHVFDTGIQKLIPRHGKASIPAATTLRSSLCTDFLYIIKLFSLLLVLLAAHRRLHSEHPS
jgi:hypothetical protein